MSDSTQAIPHRASVASRPLGAEAHLAVSDEVRDALAAGRPVLALESSFLAHGLPAGTNLDTATEMEVAIRAAGVVPAMTALLGGKIRVGLNSREREQLAGGVGVAKASPRDFAPLVVSRAPGATTVAGTLAAATAAGIPVMATGGLGGVHRGANATWDVSGDLQALARYPVVVVCSGAKSILDLAKTMEVLESYGVPVVGLGCEYLPGFHLRRTEIHLEHTANTPQGAAEMARVHLNWADGGMLFVNPVPMAAALAPAEVERWVAQAAKEARAEGISGKAETPYLLARLSELSEGATLVANTALLVENAAMGAKIAAYLAQ